MNSFLDALKNDTNYTFTENGAIAHKTTRSDLLDMFALGGAYRNRSDEDVILMFRKAFAENEVYALRCLFYLRDIRGGQGERRFFRVAMHDLAKQNPDAARRNLKFIPEFGRWDDLYTFVGTSLEVDAMNFIKEQLTLDVNCQTPSLLAKWLKSENASSRETKRLARITREALGMTSAQYRRVLSTLRARINVLERLMSEGRWDEIEFDKIPSKAGLKYKNAFARHDLERARAGVQSYEDFAKDETKTVNASVLNPVDIAEQIFHYGGWRGSKANETLRLMWQKYWDNQKDWYNGNEENGIAIVDVSGSMTGTPMNAAVSMGAYIAERGKGPFQNHFITFSSNPKLVEFEGVDIYDKFQRARSAEWGGSTNIKAALDLLLNTAKRNHTPKADMPKTLYIFSDMEFDYCVSCDGDYGGSSKSEINTLLENVAVEWLLEGYELPRVIFWNLDARQNNIPALGSRFSYVSGFSMAMMEEILSGEDGYSLMMKKLDTERYSCIQ